MIAKGARKSQKRVGVSLSSVSPQAVFPRERLRTKGAIKFQMCVGVTISIVPVHVVFTRERLTTMPAIKFQKRVGVKLEVVPDQTRCTRKFFVAKMTQHPTITTAMTQPFIIYIYITDNNI